MAQPFGVGDVVGGRYRITHHVVTSADQDIVFQGIDQVLSREVSILLAATSNAKQVATSAKELAAGERESGVQVLDLGLAGDRTYLISSLIDPNALLDLVVPDAAPYVEPFFTDSLGSELFGQSRVMEPETYEDDAEYYAGLHGLSGEETEDAGARYRKRRPAFLDKVSDQLNRHLGTERDPERIGGSAQSPHLASEQEGDGQGGEQDDTGSPGPRPEAEQTAPPVQDGAGNSASSAPRPAPDQSRRRPSAPFPVPMPPSPNQTPPPADPSPRPAAEAPAPGTVPAGSALDSLPPSLLDMELVEALAHADTEEEFGVRAAQEGGFLPIGAMSFGGAAAGLHATGQQGSGSEPSDPRGLPLPSPPSASAHIAEGEEVVDDPPPGPVPTYDHPRRPTPAEDTGFTAEREAEALGAPAQQPDSFTGLIRAVPEDRPRSFPTAAANGDSTPAVSKDPETQPETDDNFQDNTPGAGRWLAAILLAMLVGAAAVIAFLFLGTAG